MEDFTPAVNPPEFIDDPEDKKPEDWVDDEYIPDPGMSRTGVLPFEVLIQSQRRKNLMTGTKTHRNTFLTLM